MDNLAEPFFMVDHVAQVNSRIKETIIFGDNTISKE